MARSIKFSDDTYLDASGIRHTIVNKSKIVQSVANTFIYADSITIPANSDYMLFFQCEYQNTAPIGICVAIDSTDISSKYKRYLYSEEQTGASLCGYTPTNLTLYLWGKWQAAANNPTLIKGIIHTYG